MCCDCWVAGLSRCPPRSLVSYRHTELDRFHPLRQVLGEFGSGPSTVRVRLAALSPEAVARLAEPHGVDGAALHERTGGNPFFVTEVLAAGEEIPETVRDAVLARSARLTASARTLLDAVAIAPPQSELTLLEATAPDALPALDECLASGMLVQTNGAVAFRHELARLAVEEAVAPDRKLALHRATLAALRTAPEGTADLARLAHHAEAAGDSESVLELAPPAGARAVGAGGTSGGRRPVRTRAALRRRPAAREARGPAAAPCVRVLHDHAGRGRACVEPGGARGAEATGRPDQAAGGARLGRARRAQHGSRRGRGRDGARGRRDVRGDGARAPARDGVRPALRHEPALGGPRGDGPLGTACPRHCHAGRAAPHDRQRDRDARRRGRAPGRCRAGSRRSNGRSLRRRGCPMGCPRRRTLSAGPTCSYAWRAAGGARST